MELDAVDRIMVVLYGHDFAVVTGCGDGQAAAFAVANPGASMEDTLSILTVGASKYYAGHAMKFTADAGVAFDEVSGAWGGAGRGWAGDDAGANSQFVFRAQMQAIF